MSRTRGTFNLSANLEVKKDAPLDSRLIVDTKADLIKAETWIDSDNIDWTYVGMLVVAVDSPGEVFQLVNQDYTKDSSWKAIGNNDNLPTEQLATIKDRQNDIVVVDAELMDFSDSTEDKVSISMSTVGIGGDGDSYSVDFPQANKNSAGTISAKEWDKLSSIGSISEDDIDKITNTTISE